MVVLRKLCLALSVALAACSSDSPTKAGPCGRGDLSACGTSCSASSVCPGGLYCHENSCDAQCTAASAAEDCGSDKLCSSDGRCIAGAGSEDGGESDGGGLGGSDAGGGFGGTDGDGQVCGSVTLDTTPKTPNVMLIIDQSSSMRERFGGPDRDRWTALKDSLLASGGLIAELQNVVRFGATFYSASNGDEVPATECPVLTEVSIALNNFDAIRDAYPADMIEDTPTGDSIEAILAKLRQTSVLDPTGSSEDPTIFILATDGEPDTCERLDPQEGQEEAIEAVKHAHSLGINTYVIAVADEDDISEEHINALANAGVGNESGPQAESYRVDSDQGLRAALREIVGGVVSCEVRLEGTVTGDACSADVRIGGKQLSCNDPDGFELVDASLVRLNGAACEELNAGKQLTATFPCGVAVPF